MLSRPPEGFARGTFLSLVTVGFVVTTVGGIVYAVIPSLIVGIVMVAIIRSLSK